MSALPGKSPSAKDFGGVILAGGRSTRMGRPKAWLPFGGRTMLHAVVEAVQGGLTDRRSPLDGAADSADGGSPLVVVGAPDQELPPLASGIVRVDDDVEGEGPLRGMSAGIRALSGRAMAVYISSCDTPLLRPEFVARMTALLEEHDIVVPVVDGRHHPLAAVYRVSVLAEIDALLAAERRRPFFLFDRVRTREVSPDDLRRADPDLDSLRNFNTPAEYDELTARAAVPAHGGGHP
ncbi:MAG: molybdenum cofactor guanylyltransferase [Acidobacteria bacterium]|nr:molybdenum cofactor guanylyltransferase [Acidobacteriota bacterium]